MSKRPLSPSLSIRIEDSTNVSRVQDSAEKSGEAALLLLGLASGRTILDDKSKIEKTLKLDDEEMSPKRGRRNSKPKSREEASHETSTSSSKSSLQRGASGNTGRWTQPEHEAFLHGLSQCGRKWARIADIVKTRTPDQVRSHAQKHFIKIAEEGALSDGL